MTNDTRMEAKAFAEQLNEVPLAILEKLLDAGEEISEVTVWADGREPHDFFPAWGTLWFFGYDYQNDWVESHLQEISEIGFRIYWQEDFGYLLGIDGGGADFYPIYWEPLYELFVS